MSAADVILCEIHTPHAAQAGALAEVTTMVAASVGQPVIVKALVIGPATKEALLTLHLPPALAGAQHQVLCLACRLACFCPDARVSVLIRSETAFVSPPTPKRGRNPRRAA